MYKIKTVFRDININSIPQEGKWYFMKKQEKHKELMY